MGVARVRESERYGVVVQASLRIREVCGCAGFP